MTPATPPRSRSTRYSKELDKNGSLLKTPHRGATEVSQCGGPITPGSITRKPVMLLGNALVPDLRSERVITSPSKCLKSPEYTPRRSRHRRRSGILDAELPSTNRVLFPVNLKDSLIPSGRLGGKKPCASKLLSYENGVKSTSPEVTSLLLSPKRAGVFSSGIECENDGDSEAHDPDETCWDNTHKRKYAKHTPGTPTDKLISFQLAKDWNNNSAFLSSSEEEHEPINVKKIKLPNPFLSDEFANFALRRQRGRQLLLDNPDIESTVTLVNKKGKVVEKRELTPDELDRFKPKMLFLKELEDENEKHIEEQGKCLQ
ncbi:cyclin-dependent protein serine/threonine kinase inhibiting protein SIC1 Ecym_1537 [Eremothecium cymbalariae DBVPG|uniref:Uncharacterized protein n=1 Tax=Eremothecium cymbalariae (strain CBS 270.75 / DBVPG 7215 / KCTC 17166 / NRRL Y-17582) TaxID=931890 RepID=G8JMU2_ERECY|nr:hypothetical protein Ecym_1537 [Eremothecium cymbalariae DBVPG\